MTKNEIELLSCLNEYIKQTEVAMMQEGIWFNKVYKDAKRLVKKLTIHNISKRCFCGAEYDGISCNSCGFDASEVDIY